MAKHLDIGKSMSIRLAHCISADAYELALTQWLYILCEHILLLCTKLAEITKADHQLSETLSYESFSVLCGAFCQRRVIFS